MGTLYTVTNLRKYYGTRLALDIDCLSLDSGLIYALAGVNGAGKSTLMQVLAFLEPPDSGSISFCGQDLAPGLVASFRSQVVWMPQQPLLFSGTVLYNVAYPMQIRGVPGPVREAKAKELLRRVGLCSLANRSATNISGGEGQRISLARALATGARVLLLDEPTAGVDVAARKSLICLIHELWQEHGLSVIVTTHDPGVAEQLCQKTIHLEAGCVITHTG